MASEAATRQLGPPPWSPLWRIGRAARSFSMDRVIPWSGGQITMAFELPPLPYDYNALEPYIDAQTMQLHHDKHHQAYVTNLNAALEGTDLEGKTVEEALA